MKVTPEQLGREVLQRRTAIKRSQRAVAIDAEISPTSLNHLELGKTNRPHPVTLAKLSVALGWPPDGLARIAGGEDAAALPAATQERPTHQNSPPSVLDVSTFTRQVLRYAQRTFGSVPESLTMKTDEDGNAFLTLSIRGRWYQCLWGEHSAKTWAVGEGGPLLEMDASEIASHLNRDTADPEFAMAADTGSADVKAKGPARVTRRRVSTFDPNEEG